MKNYKRIQIFIFVCISFISTQSFSQNQLKGKVIDVMNSSPMVGANIYISDLKTGAVTGPDGTYTINNIPAGTYIVEAKFLGYGLQTKSVTISGITIQDFNMAESDFEGQEVVITGTANGTDPSNTPLPIVEVPNSFLFQNASTNVIDALSKVPGVSGITDGQSIAKPVIRGLGYNRVVTVNDGVRQEGQQWGDEFGIEVDPNSVDRVEVLKGPASLVYGSDAISGVINLIPEKNLPEGQIKGEILGNYQTNNGLYNGMASIAGTNNGISWGARFSDIAAHAYQNKYDGYVFNSQFSNLAYDATVGIHRSWGYSQLHFSHFELRTGIVEGARDSLGNQQKQILDASGNPSYINATTAELKSYQPFLIHQLVQHTKLVWDNSIAVGTGRIMARFAYQSNDRAENNDITMPDVSNIHYHLNTINYDVRYISPTKNDLDYSVGINGMSQNSTNLGPLLLIPEYNLLDVGAFGIVNKKIGNLSLSGGLRFDTRQFNGHDSWIDSTEAPAQANAPGALHRFTGYTSNFNGVSGSVGAVYQFNPSFYLKANISRGFRAPNVAETGSDGIHDGTVIYEKGDKNLQPEQSLEFDLAPGIKNKDITIEADLFVNSISNYIFTKAVLDAKGNQVYDSSTAGFGPAPVFKYTQSNAMLTGGEIMLDIHPHTLPWIDFYAAYSMVNANIANVPDSIKYLPFVPPAKMIANVTFMAKKLGKTFNNAYFRIGLQHVFAQNDVYLQSSDYTGLNTEQTPAEYAAARAPTAAYTLLNAGLGTDIMGGNGKKLCSLFISVDNLTDEAYMDYMSRFKYYPANYSTNPVRVGVYNMGRNVSFKLLIPISIKG